MTPEVILTQSHALKTESLARRLALIRAAAPEVVADAERYVELRPATPPWADVVLSSLGEELDALRDRYDIHFCRHRPNPRDVIPQTDLFYEAWQLLAELPAKK